MFCNCRGGANGLPTPLVSPCIAGSLLPAQLRQFGQNTIIHQAVSEHLDAATFRKILEHPSCPNLNIRLVVLCFNNLILC